MTMNQLNHVCPHLASIGRALRLDERTHSATRKLRTIARRPSL